MVYQIETIEESQRVLIVDKHAHVSTLLKESLQKYEAEIFISPKMPDKIHRYDICFFIDEGTILTNIISYREKLQLDSKKKFVFIFLNNPKKTEYYHQQLTTLKITNIKLINSNGEFITAEQIDQILWFTFSETKETYLSIGKEFKKTVVKKINYTHKELFRLTTKKYLRPRKIFFAFFLLVLLIHILFIPFLIFSGWRTYTAVKYLQKKDFNKTHTSIQQSLISLQITKQLFPLARPTFLLLSVAHIPDNSIQLIETTDSVLSESIQLYEKTSYISRMLFQKQKTADEINMIAKTKDEVGETLDQITQQTTFLYQKIPDWNENFKKIKAQLTNALSLGEVTKKLLPYFDDLLAKDQPKQYLLLFANNMELRPGGGFIGSFGVLSVDKYTINDIKIYDVYDADGQLKTHIDPPDPIRDYLGQPHWYLRDSAFSPDFYTNYQQAKSFLSQEMNLSSFDGAILITTSAIQNVLQSIGDLYIPDYKETVNKDNFYIKAQLYSEKDFFPGSIQKKQFLSSVMDQLLLQIENNPSDQLPQLIKKSLDEKQMVVYLENQDIQKIIDSLYWSGRVVDPSCTTSSANCITDYLMLVDANLGVNKANFFTSKSLHLDVSIDREGHIHNTLLISYKNGAQSDVFPGGTYKNYLQLLLPTNTTVAEITRNNTLIEKYDDNDNNLHENIGFLDELKPQDTHDIVIKYELPQILKKGNGTYQLIVQKQIGSANSDFSLTVKAPSNVYILNQNFTPLVKGNLINYNTTIVADKFFYIELLKE